VSAAGVSNLQEEHAIVVSGEYDYASKSLKENHKYRE
jgi:hypothetical protein